MTVKELVERLKALDPDLEVVVPAGNSYDVESLNNVADVLMDVDIQPWHKTPSIGGPGYYWSKLKMAIRNLTTVQSRKRIPRML